MACCLAAGSVALAQEGEGEQDPAWDRSVAFGLTLTAGNSESTLATFAAKAEREWDRHAVRFGLEGAYGEAETERDDGTKRDEPTAQNAKANINYKAKGKLIYTYGDLTALHDEIADVDYRFIVGPGVGIQSAGDAAKLEFDVGVAWVMEEVGGADDAYMAYRAGERYEWKLSATAKLWQSVEFVPKADDFDDYLLTAEAGLEAAVNAHISLRFVIQDKYDSVPAAGQESNDLITTTALSVKL